MRKTVMVTLSEIVVDPTVQVRSVKSYTVSAYAQAMKAGAQFPPMVLVRGDNRLAAGNHRYYAYKQAKEPNDKVPCVYQEFENDAAIIRFAAGDNIKHGRPLDTWDKKNIAYRLEKAGDSKEAIANLLNVSMEKIEEWNGLMVMVCGKREGKAYEEPRPVKHHLEHLAKSGGKLTSEQYESHARGDLGVDPGTLARQLTRIIVSGKVDTGNEKAMFQLRALHEALAKMFEPVTV